jgi:hypothetical protein
LRVSGVACGTCRYAHCSFSDFICFAFLIVSCFSSRLASSTYSFSRRISGLFPYSHGTIILVESDSDVSVFRGTLQGAVWRACYVAVRAFPSERSFLPLYLTSQTARIASVSTLSMRFAVTSWYNDSLLTSMIVAATTGTRSIEPATLPRNLRAARVSSPIAYLQTVA